MKISLTEDKPDTVYVFSDPDDESEFIEVPIRNTVSIYTGKEQ